MSHLFLFRTCGTLATILLMSAVTCASDPDPTVNDTVDASREKAAECVASALKAEAKGDFVARQRLLAEAQLSEDFAPAQWQLGKLLDENQQWADVETLIEQMTADEKLNEYERRRGIAPDNFANQVSLATWCSSAGLLDQCRAHLTRALEFEPDNVGIRQALGYRNVGGEWASPAEVVEFSERIEATRKSIEKYARKINSIAKKLASKELPIREAGITELKEISDADAVPAVENILASPSPLIAGEAIEWFGATDSVESSQALMRFSLEHPSALVRDAAAKELKQRPLHDFVPDLLQMLTSPVSMMVVPEFDRLGNLLGYRKAFSRETVDKIDIVLVDRSITRTSVRGLRATRGQTGAGAFQVSLNRFVEQSVRNFAIEDTRNNSIGVRRVNLVVKDRNLRIAEVLSKVTDEEFGDDPEPMWKWWDKYNETKYQDYKPERYVRTAIGNRIPRYELERTSGECFVAGTLVVSSRGMKAIESVMVGDTVLSRNVESGELCWKPVLRATTRPPEATYEIDVDGEQLKCTSGHLFWVSGAGWKKASELKPADILHAAEEPRVVSSIRESETAPTFNLQVADNSNYFVGKAMILTHDVTPRSNSRQIVPGLRFVP